MKDKTKKSSKTTEQAATTEPATNELDAPQVGECAICHSRVAAPAGSLPSQEYDGNVITRQLLKCECGQYRIVRQVGKTNG